MRAVGYVRVSTEEQERSGLGLEAQRQAIMAECDRQGWQLVRIVEEIGSGTRTDRDGLAEAVAIVNSGEADALVCAKLDRLSRSAAQFTSLLERFRRHGWGLVLLDLGVDTTSMMGEAMATVAATFAQLEARRIGERTREALAVARSRGVRLGRPPSVDESVAVECRRLRARGLSYRAIAARLEALGVVCGQGGRWHGSSVRALVLRQPV